MVVSDDSATTSRAKPIVAKALAEAPRFPGWLGLTRTKEARSKRSLIKISLATRAFLHKEVKSPLALLKN
jgi:hypothetical protein